MNDTAVQIGIAAFGLTALWMAMGKNDRQRKWAPIIGLIGQVFWITFAWQAKAFGIGVLTAAYTAVYLRGAWVQWRPAREQSDDELAALEREHFGDPDAGTGVYAAEALWPVHVGASLNIHRRAINNLDERLAQLEMRQGRPL